MACVCNRGPWSLTKQIVRENGLRGLFRGLVPTFMREMPGYFFFFGGYEFSRTLLTPPGTKKEDLSKSSVDCISTWFYFCSIN